MTDIEIILTSSLQDRKEFYPTYSTPYSAAMDLKACIDDFIYLYPNQVTIIDTGIKLNIKSNTTCALILPRSGLGAKHGIILANNVGLIDPDYQGPIKVALWNRNKEAPPFKIQRKDRIAQILFTPIERPNLQIVQEFSNKTVRGEGGFNHTGVK